MQIINPTICQQMSALNSGITHFFDFVIIANNWLMGKSRCNDDKLVLGSGTKRISTTKLSCGSSRTILVLLCVPVQHQYQHLIYSGSQYFILSQPWMPQGRWKLALESRNDVEKVETASHLLTSLLFWRPGQEQLHLGKRELHLKSLPNLILLILLLLLSCMVSELRSSLFLAVTG